MIEFIIHEDKEKYALVNYEEIIQYYKLPLYKRLINRCPTKILIKINEDEVNN